MKLIKILLPIISLYWFFVPSVLSESIIKVENVFLDIGKDYTYHYELQTLYDMWIIEPESDFKFHPDRLLNRDDFVWIAVETSCQKCIPPNTLQEFIDSYTQKPFFDVWLDNKNFYCISYAKENEFVLGYDQWVQCSDWTQKDWEIPFCTKNNIKLEEALAVVMRMWWIMTVEEANVITSGIENGQAYPDLALDMKALYDDWTANSFYPYFKKALEYEVLDYDSSWNEKNYKLVEKSWEYLRPTTLITKQDFLKMAFVALKANSCSDISDNELAIKIIMFDQTCDEQKALKWECSLQDYDDTLDFDSEVWWVCEQWIDEESWYIWRFVSQETWEQTIKYWKYIDNYNFLSPQEYKVFLRVTDNCGNTSEVYNTLTIYWVENWLWLDVIADKVYWEWPLEVNFDWIVEWWTWPYICSWDYGDWNTWEWEDTTHTFEEPWVYEVTTKCVDSNWLESEVTTVITVIWEDSSDWLWLDVISDKVYWEWPLEVNFDWIVEWWTWPYICSWDYGDWNTWEWEDTTHTFEEPWVYEVTTKCVDSNWLESEVTTVIKVTWEQEDISLTVSIDANPIVWNWPLEVDLKPIVFWWEWPYQYAWNLGDGATSILKLLKHIFLNKGLYEVTLTVVDSNWLIGKANTMIKVLENICSNDYDWDWKNDCEDTCPLVKWESNNDWCPIFIEEESYSDHLEGLWECLIDQKDSWFIFWNVVCVSCPCNSSLDFRSTLRKCDTIIPAITSPTEETIYSRWRLFQIR